MPKKILLLVWGLLLLLTPLVQAQDDRLVIDLSDRFTVQDLGFSFPYPQGWLLDNSNGIRLAETEADLLAATDDDPSTHAEGYTLRVLAVPAEALELEDPTLDNLVDTFVELVGITVEEQTEFPVMSRRAITLSGVDGDDEPGVLSAWLQDEYIVFLAMGIPKEVGFNSDVYYTWGYLMAQVSMISDVQESAILEFEFAGGALINYPVDWVADSGDFGMVITTNAKDMARFKQDAPQEDIEDTLFYFIIRDLAPNENLTAEQGFDNLISSGTFLNPTRLSEHIIFDLPALSFWAEDSVSGLPMTLALGVVEDQFYLVFVQSPDESSREAYYPIFLNMLNSLRLAN